jgi:hypothetical protein
VLVKQHLLAISRDILLYARIIVGKCECFRLKYNHFGICFINILLIAINGSCGTVRSVRLPILLRVATRMLMCNVPYVLSYRRKGFYFSLSSSINMIRCGIGVLSKLIPTYYETWSKVGLFLKLMLSLSLS